MNYIISDKQYLNMIRYKIKQDRLKRSYLFAGSSVVIFVLLLAVQGFNFTEFYESTYFWLPIIFLGIALVSLIAAFQTNTKSFRHHSVDSYKAIDPNIFKHPVYAQVIYRRANRGKHVSTHYGCLTYDEDKLTVLCVRNERDKHNLVVTRDGTTFKFYARKYDTLVRYRSKVEIVDFNDTYLFYTYPKYSDKLLEYLKSKGFKVELYTN